MNAVALDDHGGILVAGGTQSPYFPHTPAAYDGTPVGDQQLTYCTFVGGSQYDWVSILMRHPDGSVAIGGATLSSTFPTTPGAYDQSHNGGWDIFVSRPGLPVRAYCFGTGCPCGNDFNLSHGIEVEFVL